MKCVCIGCADHYETRFWSVMKYFRSIGLDVKYVTSDYHQYKKEYYKAPHEDCVQLHVPAYQRDLSAGRIISHLVFSKKVYSFLLEESPDVVYCMFPPNSLVRNCVRYKRRSGCVLIFDSWDNWPESFPSEGLAALLKPAFAVWARLRDAYLPEADLLVTVAESGRMFFKNKVSAPIAVLKPTVDISVLPEYDFDVRDRLSFCYLGNIGTLPDLELIEAFFGALSKRKRLSFHLIGEGQNKPQLLDALRSHGVEIIEHGFVYDIEEKRRIFAQCNLGICMPRRAVKSTMALKAVEYMSVGLPFINTCEGDMERIVAEERIGVTISDETVDEIVDFVAGLGKDELKEMHSRSIECYEKKFLHQDYGGTIGAVLRSHFQQVKG